MVKQSISKRTREQSDIEIINNYEYFRKEIDKFKQSGRKYRYTDFLLEKVRELDEARKPILKIFKRNDVWEPPDRMDNLPPFAFLLICPINEDTSYQKITELLKPLWPQVENLRYYLREGKQRLRKTKNKPESIEMGQMLSPKWPATIEGETEGEIHIFIMNEGKHIRGEIWNNITCGEFAKALEKQKRTRKKILTYCQKIALRKNRRGRRVTIPPELKKTWYTSKGLFSREDRELFGSVYISQNFTLTEAAQRRGISKGRASQICKSILNRMGMSEKSDSEEIQEMFSKFSG